jgi:hypothetical protein
VKPKSKTSTDSKNDDNPKQKPRHHHPANLSLESPLGTDELGFCHGADDA